MRRNLEEGHGSWRRPKTGYAELGIAILAKIRPSNFGRQIPFGKPHALFLQNLTHVYLADSGRTPRKQTETEGN